jgi:hypothetical protein
MLRFSEAGREIAQAFFFFAISGEGPERGKVSTLSFNRLIPYMLKDGCTDEDIYNLYEFVKLTNSINDNWARTCAISREYGFPIQFSQLTETA